MTTFHKLPAVLARCAISRSQLYALIAKGEFPRQVRLSTRSVGWTSDSIEAWIADRIAASKKGAI